MKIYCCKKCSEPLFLEEQTIEHQGVKKVFASQQECQIFINKPSKWMKLEGESGEICCPKCDEKLGQFVWHGETCSCGELVIPYIAFTPSKLLITQAEE